MDKRFNKLIGILEEDGIVKARNDIKVSSIKDDFLSFFRIITPDRHIHYDTEIIDDIDKYSVVLGNHAEATLSEWVLQDLFITGNLDGYIEIRFTHKDKDFLWSLNQAGSDYVDSKFYDELNSWVSKNLTGRYVSLETGGQDVSYVYLPKKVADKVEQFIKKFFTVDMFVEQFRVGDEISNSVWAAIDSGFKPTAKDSQGETALTAAIKAKNETMALLAIEHIEDLNNIKNKQRKTPLQLAREYKLGSVIKELEERVAYKDGPWDELGSFLRKKDKDDKMCLKLFSSIKKTISPEKCFKYVHLKGVILGKSETFEVGVNTLSIFVINHRRRVSPSQAYLVTMDADKPLKNITGKKCTLDEAMEIVKLFYS